MTPLQLHAHISQGAIDTTIVMLHGYSMDPERLLPFAPTLLPNARFLAPVGPIEVEGGGRSWWQVDAQARDTQIAEGPRDLAERDPPGREAARAHLAATLDALEREHGPLGRLVLAGFSQGGMISCDFVLHEPRRVHGLAMLSASRVAMHDWTPRLGRLAGLPVFVAHGHADDDLSFGAGEALRDCAQEAGAQVTWVPFDGGHEIPMLVWRRLRQWLHALPK